MSGHDSTVLVVDDDPEALALLIQVLGEAGYRVQPADSGMLALASLKAHPPELILLDVRMPGMSGFEVCRQIRASEEGRGRVECLRWDSRVPPPPPGESSVHPSRGR